LKPDEAQRQVPVQVPALVQAQVPVSQQVQVPELQPVLVLARVLQLALKVVRPVHCDRCSRVHLLE
jgi:hypothetical protein